MSLPDLPVSYAALTVALNMMTALLLIEAYYRPPIGWVGRRMARAARIVWYGNAILFGFNFSSWLIDYLT